MAASIKAQKRAITEPPGEHEQIDIDALIRQLEQEFEARQKLAELLNNTPTSHRPLKMSYEEFLEWADEDTLAEWVNGEVIMSSPASLPHQRIVDFLVNIINMFVTSRDLGAVLSAPFQMKMEQGREPDMLFIARAHLGRLKHTYLDGPADLVVEVMSPESIGRDRGEKFYEYERGGVPEYWLIDPLTQRAEFYQLRAGRYALIPPGAQGCYHSGVLPNFWLQIEWLWQTPLPHALQVLGEIVGIEPEALEQFLARLKGK